VVRLAGLLLLLAAAAFCQVKVTVKLDRPEYLVGEPIFVLVDATNIGTEAIGYSACDGHANLTVPGGEQKKTPQLRGCGAGASASGSGCGVDHPPTMKPGQTVSFRYLLEGYRLQRGDYILRATGKAGVRWFFGYGRNVSAGTARKTGDPVEGAMFDVSLGLNIREGTEQILRQRYARYIEEAASGSVVTERSFQAREAIAEMAPPFLEKTILEFANRPESASLAVEGLGQIPTPESRADLKQLFDRTTDSGLRGLIVEKLAVMGTTDELTFFSSLLGSASGDFDGKVQVFGILGIGRLGGEAAVKILGSTSPSPNQEVRQALAMALGNTRSSAAVPLLIAIYSDESVRNEVCWALATLTHYQWCDGGGTVLDLQNKWRSWWRTNGSRIRLYGMDECPAPGSLRQLDSAF
jgi:hypothetical protein